MKVSLSLYLAFANIVSAGQGLVGFGLDPVGAYCGWACYMPVAFISLSCSSLSPETGFPVTSVSCRANDTAWLTTLAWCMHTRCTPSNMRPSDFEEAWENRATLSDIAAADPPYVPAKWTYSEALHYVLDNGPPTRELAATDLVLNFTAVISDFMWLSQWNDGMGIQREQIVGATYGIIILVIGFSIPIIMTWLGYLPFMSRLTHKLNPRLIYPSLIGRYNVQPLPHQLGNALTRGQGLAIVIFFLLNLFLTSVNYRSFQPHALRPQVPFEISSYIVYRTGIIAFALLPLLLLFSSRNNVLLWFSNWSHATYLLLHRWVARLFFLQALVHTLVALPFFYGDAKRGYWIWGSVAIVAMALLLLTSVLWVRRKAYEFFLASHIILSVITLVGCWYHVTLWVGIGTWGYETWLYAACAVWFVDRLARGARVLKNGLRRAKVVELGGEYVRVDVPGVRWGTGDPGAHMYAYFPTLGGPAAWRRQPWENHPFSIVPTAVLVGDGQKNKTGDEGAGSRSSSASTGRNVVVVVEVDVEKGDARAAGKARPRVKTAGATGSNSVDDDRDDHRLTVAAAAVGADGITLLIKKSAGITKHLCSTEGGLLTLLDGPYSNAPTTEIRRCDRLLLIGGGIGITSLLSWTVNHLNVKLCWSVKESARCLVAEVEGALGRVQETDVRVGSRLDFDDLLAREVECGWRSVGVVVSGPGGLCDDVRAAVVAAGEKGKTAFVLEVDAYTW
ncbi:ferric reductase like transmembrane component-domain-containing protein [Apodospora peruviana]|uniref:Ferric reductase like transmembrane component-domain-containing protein n=1 Tax=Apodospora peruviana TaxID=516989 RepID=A0AAE0HSK8_9PEZI|nr:ferric reductase like transmembrane component-domain-containing protein [Apodospora peruviana]